MFNLEEQQEDGDLATVVRLIKEIRIALCTSVDREGMPHARPVQTLAAEGDGSLWFFTDWHSDKVAELRRDDRVALGYADPSRSTYVTVSGRARLFRDPVRARELWSVEQRAYYPDGPEDARLALLQVSLVRAEYWIAPGRLSYLVAAVRAAVTGQPAEVIGQHDKVP
jgi:general stress protein 26